MSGSGNSPVPSGRRGSGHWGQAGPPRPARIRHTVRSSTQGIFPTRTRARRRRCSCRGATTRSRDLHSPRRSCHPTGGRTGLADRVDPAGPGNDRRPRVRQCPGVVPRAGLGFVHRESGPCPIAAIPRGSPRGDTRSWSEPVGRCAGISTSMRVPFPCSEMTVRRPPQS